MFINGIRRFSGFGFNFRRTSDGTATRTTLSSVGFSGTYCARNRATGMGVRVG